jgi:heme/copper-type cytochrome/quinol oxidase subunit 2
MDSHQTEAWKRVKNAGTVNIVVGWIGVAFCVPILVLALIFIVANFPITDSDGSSMPSWVLGVIFAVVCLVFMLPVSIVNVISGVKLRNQTPSFKGWLIYSIIIGAINTTSLLTLIPGVLQMVFAIIAISSSHLIADTKPPKETKS